MSNTDKFNGWANYETWNILLWTSNDKSCYDAQQAYQQAHGAWTAASVEAFTCDMFPDGTPDFSHKGGAAAFERVDWQEIADNWNEK